MEYALLIDSYRTTTIRPKPILSVDNLAYLCGLFLMIIPFTKLSFYFTFVTFGYILLVFLFLGLKDLGILTIKLTKKKTQDNEIKLKIIYKNEFSFFLPSHFFEKRNLCHLLFPPDPG